MASYTVIGHPLNYATLDLPDFAINAIKIAPTGATISLVVADDSEAEGQAVLQ